MPRYTRFMHDNSQTAALWDDAALADAARFDSIEERLARIEAHLWPPVDPDAPVRGGFWWRRA